MDFFGFNLLTLGVGNSELGQLMSLNKSEAQIENQLAFIELFNRFANIAVTRIIWHDLPESVSQRFLNTALFAYGQAAFFADPEMGLMCLPCTVAGSYNAYYEPTRVNAFSFNYQRMLDKDDFVFIRNNPTCTPTAFPIWMYTKRMANVLRTIDVLVSRMKHPYLFLCDEKQRLTFINLVKKIQDNELMVLGAKNFGTNDPKMETLDLKIEPYFQDLWFSYKQLEDMLYTALGINNANTEKKERLLTDEVNANNMVIDASIETTVKELEKACTEINTKFNLHISVEIKEVRDYTSRGDIIGTVYD